MALSIVGSASYGQARIPRHQRIRCRRSGRPGPDYDPNAEQECVVGRPAGERIGRDATNPPHAHLPEAPLT